MCVVAHLPRRRQRNQTQEASLPATRSEEEWTLELLERRVIVHPGHFYDFPFGPLIVVSLIQTCEAFKREPERLEALLAEK